MPSLQIRTTHNNTLVQLHQHKHTATGHGFVDGSRGCGHLLVEWTGPPVNQRSRIPVRWGEYHRPVCVERLYRERNGYISMETQHVSAGWMQMLQCSLLSHPCTLDDLLKFNGRKRMHIAMEENSLMKR